MKAKFKVILVLFIIILVVFVRSILSSYAKYTNIEATGTGGDFNTWNIKINNQDITDNKVITLEEKEDRKIFKDDETEQLFPTDVLAPGNFGYFNINIDYSDVTVPFIYDISAKSDSTNRNIIDYIRVYNGEDDTAVRAYMQPIFNSSLSVNNPLVGNVGTDIPERTMTVRVYVVWKQDTDETNDYIDNVTTNEGINYKITLYFRQDIEGSSETPTPPPTPVEYGLEIADRTNIIDYDGNGKISEGDEIDLQGERFYVLNTKTSEIDGKTNHEVKMLAKYNLNVNAPNEEERIQNECSSINCNLPFYTNPEHLDWGYWIGIFKTDFTYVYSDKSNLYSYVENYKKILSEKGYKALTVSVPSYNDILNVCKADRKNCNSPDWLFSTSYWTGSAISSSYIWTANMELGSSLFTSNTKLYSSKASVDNRYGLRPTVIINAKDI